MQLYVVLKSVSVSPNASKKTKFEKEKVRK